MNLDIGCGRHKMPNCIGVDIKEDSDADIVASVYNMPQFPHRFDIIHMREVLEHLDKPLEALEEVRQLLKPDGVLRLTVPNMLSIDCILRWSIFGRLTSAPEHINGWTLPDIEHLVERAGFIITRTAFETPRRYYPGGRLRRLFSWIPRLAGKSIVLFATPRRT